jgi:SAM-dependent methyltransferase
MTFDKLKQRLGFTYLHPRYLAMRELRRVVAELSVQLTGQVIDIGCGKKPYASYLIRVDRHYGLDVPTTIHGLAHVDVIGSALALPIADGVLDGCLCSEVLEHLPDPLQALCEMNRVTKEKGKLLLTVPFSEPLHELPFDYYRFTEIALRHLLTQSGWTVSVVHQRGGEWLELGYRLSAFLYSGFGARLDQTGRFRPRLAVAPLIVPLCAFVQLIATLLDACFPRASSTIGYGVLAVKQPEQP